MKLAHDRHDPSGPAGAPAPTPVVLLHGLSSTRRSYRGIVDHLPDRLVLNADLRGHGDSPRGPSYRAVDYAADVAELIGEEIGRSAAIVGHSLGGLNASALAATEPDLVAGILVEDPPLFEGDAELRAASPAAKFFPELVAVVSHWQTSSATVAHVAEAVGSQPSPHGVTTLERLGAEAVRDRAEGLLQLDVATIEAAIDGVAWDGYDPAATMGCPVTVLRADPAIGAVFRPDDVEPYQRAVPHAHIRMVAGQGHGIHSDPDGVGPYLDALDAFLTTVDAGAKS